MKIGYNEGTTIRTSDLKTDLILTEEYGYDYIELRVSMLQTYLETNTLDDLVSFFEASHVQPHCINAVEPINFAEGTYLKKLLADTEFACRIASSVNNPYLIAAPSFGNIVQHYSYDEIQKDTVQILHRITDIAEKYGVKIALEPIGTADCAVRSVAQACDIIQQVDRDSVGIALDVFNQYAFDGLREDYKNVLQLPPEKVFVFHINDVQERPLYELSHCHRVMPGAGNIDLDPYIQLLDDIGYEGMVSVELFNPFYWTLPAEDVIRLGYSTTKAAIDKALADR